MVICSIMIHGMMVWGGYSIGTDLKHMDKKRRVGSSAL